MHKRASSLAQLVAQDRLRHFSLPSPLPATCGQTKALLQSALADKRSQKFRLVTLMLPATEQQTKRKRDSQAAKNSTRNKKLRFLNMISKQVLWRYKRIKQREYRKAVLQSSSDVAASVQAPGAEAMISLTPSEPLELPMLPAQPDDESEESPVRTPIPTEGLCDSDGVPFSPASAQWITEYCLPDEKWQRLMNAREARARRNLPSSSAGPSNSEASASEINVRVQQLRGWAPSASEAWGFLLGQAQPALGAGADLTAADRSGSPSPNGTLHVDEDH